MLGLAAVPAVLAQGDTNAPVEIESIVVTGSLIPTAATVNAAPVDIYSEETLLRTGSYDVLQAIKKLTPVFSGNVNVGQEVNNGGFGESNVGLRNLPTLVLLNGRRLGNSSFSNGQFVDLNTIPISMIERVEILKDGASALYGSEAVGGVVNIITKKNFNGVELGARYGFATQDGSVTEKQFYIVGGTSTEKSSFVAGAQYYQMDALLSTDREIAHLDLAGLNARGQSGAVAYLSPSYDGEVQQGGQRYVLAGSPHAQGLPGYNPAVVTPPVLPGQTFSGATAVTDYNAAAVAAGFPTPYLPTSVLLNTPLFGTHSIQPQERANVFGTANHELFGKRMEVFGEFLYANSESEGVLAPSPVVGLGVKQANIDVPAGNVHNPFGVNLGPNGVLAPRVRSRFVDSGNRIFASQSDYYHFVGGLKGQLDNDYGYEANYTYNRYDQVQYTKNAVNGAALDLALQPNANAALAGQGLSRLVGSDGRAVPMYNLFSIGGRNDPATINAIKTTLFQTGVSEDWGAGGVITGMPFELPAGKIAFAAGGGFNSASLEIDFDGLTKIGKVPGLNASDPTSGRRDSWAGFVEVRIPIFSPENEIPALHDLEITAAGRYETFDPGGDAAVPKVGIRWQPIDKQLTLRGSYSQSFIAPTTFQLFGGSQVSNPFITTPDTTAQQTTVRLSNNQLEPIDGENFGGGVVYSPEFVKGLTVSLDYYHVETENDIFRVSEQVMVDDLNRNGSASQWQPFYQFDNGSRVTTTAPNQVLSSSWGSLFVPLLNGAQVETDGIELAANYQIPTESSGTFTIWGNANIVLSFDYADPIIGGPYAYEGQYTDESNGIGGAQGTIPDFLVNGGVTWDFPLGTDELSVALSTQYVPEIDDLGTLHPAVGSTSNDFTVDGGPWTVDDWFRVDLQVSYEIGKHKTDKSWYDGTRLTFGVNNITDEDTPLVTSSFEDNTDKSTYDLLGRFVYFAVAKKF
jgi:iron complex outermembrane receptor protein